MVDPTGAAPQRLYIGSYTASSGGSGRGISVLERSRSDGRWQSAQLVEVDDPSFLVVTEGALHAVSETDQGRVLSFSLLAGRLEFATQAASGGAAPCHIAHDRASGALVVANYVGGTFGVLSSDGTVPARVTSAVALPAGHGPVAERQQGPHAHQVVSTPWGTHLVSDLGSDRLVEFSIDGATLEPTVLAEHGLPSGSGPRHMDWLGEQLVVAGELDGRLHVLSRVDGRLVVDRSVPVSPHEPSAEGDLLSHLSVHGSRVYVATRGRDTIGVFEATSGSGGLTFVGEAPCGGAWPRHFTIAGDALYCANQGSDTVSVLPLDPRTGLPGKPVDLFTLGSPACIVAV